MALKQWREHLEADRATKRLRAFSLIELLVTVSVIALLIGLLLPVLSAQRRAARIGACGSNLRQIALANHLYTVDERGRFAPGASNFLENLNRWHGTRSSPYETFESHDGPLSNYLGANGAIRQCPEWQPAGDPDPGTDFEAGSGGYGYNQTYLGVSSDGEDTCGVRLTEVNAPHRTLMFTDTAFALAWPSERLIEYSFATPPHPRDHPDQNLDPSIHFRHERQASIVWVDQHVSREPLAFTRAGSFGVNEERMWAFGVGWFGRDDNGWFDLQ